MLQSVQTMDRFDDPKQKQIVINFKEWVSLLFSFIKVYFCENVGVFASNLYVSSCIAGCLS